MSRLSRWVSLQPKPEFNDFPSTWDYEKRYKLYEHVLQTENLEQPLVYLEFGVANGQSFNWWMGHNQHPDSLFFGFDTFTGLPEDFGNFKKGTFNTVHNIPSIPDQRGKFFQGLFQQTFPDFLRTFSNSNRKVIMLDADLFSSTLFVLTSLSPHLREGDILFFDEFGVPTHEFMAFKHFVESHYIPLEFIASANNYYFTAFKVGASPAK